MNDKGYKQYDLFKLGGVPHSTISDVINVKKKRVTTDTIYQICSIMGISLKEFFNDDIFNNISD